MQGGGKHKRSKHFTIEFDAMREFVALGDISVQYCETEQMPADIVTKSLSRPIFERHRDRILKSSTTKERERDGKKETRKDYDYAGRHLWYTSTN